MGKLHKPLLTYLRRRGLRALLTWVRYATSATLLLHVVLSWSPTLDAEGQSGAVIGPIDTDGAETRWGSLGHNQHTNTTAILRSTCSPYSTLWARARLQGYTAVWNKASALRDTFLVWSTPLMPTCPQLKLCKIS